MKKWTCTLAVLGAAACPAWSQSSVTVFGIMDLAARSVNNEGVGSVKSLASGGNSTSRIGLRGTEDLGSGLSAGFHLEGGLQADTGSSVVADQFWDRRATVSVADKKLGEVRLGRDYTPTYTNWVRFDPFSYVGVAGASNLISGAPVGPVRAAFGTGKNTVVRSSNSLQYLLPADLWGIEGGLMVAAGEGGTAANGQDKVVAGRLGYARGPVFVSVAGATTENDVTADSKFKDYAAAGSYDAGVVKLSLGWRRFAYADARQTNLLAAAIVPVGLADIKISYLKANLEGRVGAADISANDASQFTVGGVYNLSKRSAVYATVARIDNRGGARFVVPGGATGIVAGGSSTGYEAGVRHNF